MQNSAECVKSIQTEDTTSKHYKITRDKPQGYAWWSWSLMRSRFFLSSHKTRQNGATLSSSKKQRTTSCCTDLWHSWTQSHSARGPALLALRFPSSFSMAHFSRRALLLLQSSGPSNTGIDITTQFVTAAPPLFFFFCKTISSTLICPGDIPDVPKQNHQLRQSFSSCHPCLAATR